MRRNRTTWKSWILTVMMLVWVCCVSVLAEGASGDNSLYSLGITADGVTVSPEFYYSTIEYEVTVPAGTRYLELDPVTSNSNASIVSIEGQEIGDDGTATVVITVAAENGNQCSYYLYVKTDPTTSAAVETEKETETEKQTETEPETEDPRYVKVDRNSLQEAENTITALKTETGNYRDRVNLLTKILYGMIGLCVILLFVVINLILKKKDLKAELQEYAGYGYPEQMNAEDQSGSGYEDGSYYQDGGQYENESYYQDGSQYENEPYYQDGGQYENGSYDQDGGQYGTDSYYQEGDQQEAHADNGQQEAPSSRKDNRQYEDNPDTVPKPSKAKRKVKSMPEYDAPQPEHQYQPPKGKTSDDVEVNMIDL